MLNISISCVREYICIRLWFICGSNLPPLTVCIFMHNHLPFPPRSTRSLFSFLCSTVQLYRRTIRSACVVPSTPIHRRVVHFNFLSFFSGENTWNNYKWISDELVEIQNSLSTSATVLFLYARTQTSEPFLPQCKMLKGAFLLHFFVEMLPISVCSSVNMYYVSKPIQIIYRSHF